MELWSAPHCSFMNFMKKDFMKSGGSRDDRPKIAQKRRGSPPKKVIKDRIRAPKWGGGGGRRRAQHRENHFSCRVTSPLLYNAAFLINTLSSRRPSSFYSSITHAHALSLSHFISIIVFSSYCCFWISKSCIFLYY